VGAEVPCGSSVAKMEGSYGVTPGDCVSCGRRRRDGGEGWGGGTALFLSPLQEREEGAMVTATAQEEQGAVFCDLPLLLCPNLLRLTDLPKLR
jgi:hypothetical protein